MLGRLKYAAAAIVSETGWVQRVSFIFLVTAPNIFQSDAADFIEQRLGIEMPVSIPLAWSTTISVIVVLAIAILKTAQKGLDLEDLINPKLLLQFGVDHVERKDDNHKKATFTIANDTGVKITGIIARLYSLQAGLNQEKVINVTMRPIRGSSPFDLRSGDHREIEFVMGVIYVNGNRDISLMVPKVGEERKIVEKTKATVRVICNESKYLEHSFEISPDDADIFTIKLLKT